MVGFMVPLLPGHTPTRNLSYQCIHLSHSMLVRINLVTDDVIQATVNSDHFEVARMGNFSKMTNVCAQCIMSCIFIGLTALFNFVCFAYDNVVYDLIALSSL